MGAISSALFSMLKAAIIGASEVCYTGAQKLIGNMLAKFGIEVSMGTRPMSGKSGAPLRKTQGSFMSRRPQTSCAYMRHKDHRRNRAQGGAMLVVDSTWSGLLLRRSPLNWGADIVITQRYQIYKRPRRQSGRSYHRSSELLNIDARGRM
jgi:cystathionine beta-lyase/cystathionine gamma-synthase